MEKLFKTRITGGIELYFVKDVDVDRDSEIKCEDCPFDSDLCDDFYCPTAVTDINKIKLILGGLENE